MKKMFGVVGVAIFLYAGSALAIPAGGVLESKTPVGGGSITVEGSKTDNINNETTVSNKEIVNQGDNAELGIGNIENTRGGPMNNVSNSTTIGGDGQLINSGKQCIGCIKQ